MPVRISDPMELAEPYVGWWVRFRINTPVRVVEKLDSKDADEVIAALAEIAQESNYVDDAGAPIDVTTTAGWREVGADVVVESVRLFREALRRPFATRPTSSPHISEGSPTESPLATA